MNNKEMYIDIHMFELTHKITIYDMDNHTNIIFEVNDDNLIESIYQFGIKYNISKYHLCGSKDYLYGLQQELIEKLNTNFSEFNVNIIEE